MVGTRRPRSVGGGAGLTRAMADSLSMVWMPAGGSYALLKPVLERLRDKAPDWALPIFSVIMWVFDAKEKGKTVRLAKATAMGKAAVGIKPSKGIPGDFRDVD